MQRHYEFRDRKLVESSNPESPVLVCISPDSSETTHLCETFNIDPHNIQSALDPDEPARVEFETDHVAIIAKRPKNYSSEDNFLFNVASLGIFLFNGRIVVVIAEDTGLFDAKHPVALETPRDVLLRVVSGIIMHFTGHLKVINMISSEIEQKINTSMENRHLFNMFSLEKSLVYYLSATHLNSAVIDKLRANAARIGLTAENVELIDDLAIENSQSIKQSEIYANVLASLMDARASIVNNNLNTLIKQLTIISIVFMPLNLIAGIGGMSEFSAMTRSIPWPISYGLFCLVMIALGCLTYWFLSRFGLGTKKRGASK